VKQRRLQKKEIYEIKKTIEDRKEEFNKDVENLRKKSQTETLEIKSYLNQIKNAEKSQYSTLEQAEDRISGLEDKTDIKERTEELSERRFKSYKRNIQELSNIIKRPNL
jgi:hypothetical protein